MMLDGAPSGGLPPGHVAADAYRSGPGILYIEDFEADGADEVPPAGESAQSAPGDQDMEAAREQGRLAGLEEARAELAAIQMALRLSVLNTIADDLRKTRQEIDKIAEARAWDLSATVLAILSAALPATAARHARSEIEAIFRVVLPGLRCEPELAVRVHPDQEADAFSVLSSLVADQPILVTVRADPALAPADVVMTWRDGSARRDSALIWKHIANALAPLGLPALEDIRHGG